MSSHVKDLVAPWVDKLRQFKQEYPHLSGWVFGGIAVLIIDLLMHLR